jgi:hypothetical protein
MEIKEHANPTVTLPPANLSHTDASAVEGYAPERKSWATTTATASPAAEKKTSRNHHHHPSPPPRHPTTTTSASDDDDDPLVAVADFHLWEAFAQNVFAPILHLIDTTPVSVNCSRGRAAGESLLMAAALHGRDGLCRYLVAAGANPVYVDKAGTSALDLARLNGHTTVVAFLSAAVGQENVRKKRVAAREKVHAQVVAEAENLTLDRNLNDDDDPEDEDDDVLSPSLSHPHTLPNPHPPLTYHHHPVLLCTTDEGEQQ